MKKHPASIPVSAPRIFFIVLFIGIVSMNICTAQIPAKDSAVIWAMMNQVSEKIETTLKADKPLYDEMMTALKKINSIKDTIEFDKALAAYRDKYLLQYGAIVKKAGVDINKVASDLKLKLPGYIFIVNNTYAIEYQKIFKATPAENKEASVSSGTTTTAITDFDKEKNEGCGAIGGADVTFDGKKVHAKSFGALTGGCSADGKLSNNTHLPSDAISISLKLKYTLRARGYAVGIVGTAGCNSTGRFTATETSGSELIKLLLEDEVHDKAIAPVAWYANYDKEKDFTRTLDLTAYKGKAVLIEAIGKSFAASAICCGTKSHGYATITKADLIVTK